MTSDYQERGCKTALIKPKGDPHYLQTESASRAKQGVAVGASPRQDLRTKAGKNAVHSKQSRRPERKLSLKELSSLCRLAETVSVERTDVEAPQPKRQCNTNPVTRKLSGRCAGFFDKKTLSGRR